MRYATSLLLLLTAVIGCDKATEPSVATTLAAISSLTVAATVGAPVSPSPSVIVKDQHGTPMAGISVTFAVTAGGGTAAGTSAITGADGIATVASWVLGTSAGTNTLTASSGSLAPVTFTASAIAGPPTAATKSDGDNAVAVVGTAVATSPAVLVRDAYGNPAQGVTVTFAVTAGGGKITDSVRTTGADGKATLGSWTLGTTATTNAVRATAGSLPPLTFIATATPGTASRILIVAGNGQTGRVNTLLQQYLAVRVTDAFDNSKSGLTVNFAVTQGGGSIAGPPVATTNFEGIAFVNGWILGPTAGTNLLTATVAGVGTVTFTATAVVQNCSDAAYTVGSTIQGELTVADCVYGGFNSIDYYRTQLTQPSSIEIRQASSEITPFTILTDANGFELAESGDDGQSDDAWMHVLAPAGTYRIGATSYDIELGRYTLSSSNVLESEEQCRVAFIVPGMATRQTIANSDCVNSSNSTLHADVFIVRVPAGALMTIHMSSSAVNPAIELYSYSEGLIATTYGLSSTTATDAELRVSRPITDYFYVVAATTKGNQFGLYDLSITTSGASVTAPSAQRGDATSLPAPRKERAKVPWLKK